MNLNFNLRRVFNGFISNLVVLFRHPIHVNSAMAVNDFSKAMDGVHVHTAAVASFSHGRIVVPGGTFIARHLVG